MLSIDPTTMDERENYKFLVGSIIPRPVAFVTTKSKEGVINGAPFSYFNIVSSNPPLISLSIQRSAGKQKDTARNIIDTKAFVVHIVDEGSVEEVNKTAARLPPEESELKGTALTEVESTKISVPGVKQAKIRMECVFNKSLELGGDALPGCDLIIGKIVQYHINDDIYHEGRIDYQALSAVSRLAGADYAKIGEVFSLERPE